MALPPKGGTRNLRSTLSPWGDKGSPEHKPVERVGVIAMIDALGIRYSGTGAAPEETLVGLLRAKKDSEWVIGFGQAISVFTQAFSQATPATPIGSPAAPSDRTRIIGLGDTLIAAVHGNDSPREQLEEIALTLTMLLTFGMMNGLFFRGAISYGRWWEFDPPPPGSLHLLGPAVDEAAEWRDQAEWIGCALTPRAGFEWERSQNFDATNPAALYTDYPVPVKHGEPVGVLKWALNWPEQSGLPRRDLLEALSKGSIPKVAAMKYVNTLSFYDEAWKRLVGVGRELPIGLLPPLPEDAGPQDSESGSDHRTEGTDVTSRNGAGEK
jgi:hypothetical protein